MNDRGDQPETNIRASSSPEPPATGASQAGMAQTQPQPLSFFERVAAFLRSDAGKVTLGVGLAALAAIVYRVARTGNRLDANRRAGARYERDVAGALEDTFEGAEVWSQVTVTTPDGRTRRPDNVLRHRNGTMTAVEIKNVQEITEEHVQQAEDHREGLRHTFGVRAGKTILVVPDGTVVKPEHESRVRVRTFTP